MSFWEREMGFRDGEGVWGSCVVGVGVTVFFIFVLGDELGARVFLGVRSFIGRGIRLG